MVLPREAGGEPSTSHQLLAASHYFSQHEWQDAAVTVVVHLDRSIDPQNQRNLLDASIYPPDLQRHLLLRLHIVAKTINAVGLGTIELQTLRIHPFAKL